MGHEILKLFWGTQHWWSDYNYRYDAILTFFNTDIENFGRKIDEGEAESIVLIVFFGSAGIVDGWRVVRSGRKSYLWAAEIASLYSRDFGQSNKYDTFWHVVTTEYFYVLFLWIIAISDCLLEIYKNVGFLLSTIAFTVNSHSDDHVIESYISFFY